ncbi:MAG: alpha/beta hydrolase fold domain-containing protein [Planctomycetota bacterium]|nr:alpha/beta hydrolase fold domain-containing protein [Planctomycetota bacterium]
MPWERYQLPDAHGRQVTCYLSRTDADQPGTRRPLVVWIQGSGCNSLFTKTPDGRVGGGLQNMLLMQSNARYRVLIVEKPGVQFLDNPQPPGAASGCAQEFLEQHTAERWRDALLAALRGALARPDVDPSHVLVVGHSEGGDMAAHVAAAEDRVTHVGVLCAGSPTQLFDLAELHRAQQGPDDSDEAAREQRLEQVYEAWSRILADPDSTDKHEWGHPHRRWSSFMRLSPMESLIQSKAKVYLAYATNDRAVPAVATDLTRAMLVAKGRDVKVERRVGEDHGFSKPGERPGEGFSEVLANVLGWWLDGDSPGQPVQ